ncbi:MAG: outer membrane protein assembly factor BamB [Acidobacteriota bacterium]|jgi:outer membrane protein assembly factor BamB|nr:outer membrane protein assembly factor BamB [Acidobacteriota bacterium]
MRRLHIHLTLALSLVAGVVAAADWPQFRGPNRDGISPEPAVLKSWPANGPKVLWKVPIGEGYAQVVSSKGRLFTFSGQGSDEIAAALDAATGKQIWRVRIDSKYEDGQGNGPRSTPTVDGDLVYVLSPRGKLAALKTANGQVAWQHDLRTEYGANPPGWGISTSPLVEGNLLVVNVGGSGNKSIIAFDKTNGKPVWTSQSDGAGYSAPIAITVRGVRQVIVFTADGIVSVSPEDGRLFWRTSWKTEYDVNAATPIFFPPDKLFVSSGYGTGSALLQINRTNVAEVWRSRGMKNQFSSSVLHNGILYGFDDSTFKAIDAATGNERWKQRGFGHGSLILAGGHLIVLSDRGKLALVEATPEEYRELGNAQVLEGKCWTSPSLADGRLYVRNEEQLIAFDWKGAAKAAPARSGK